MRFNAKLRDMNVAVAATDEGAIEVLASSLPFHHGAQFAVDITLRSALTCCGNACQQADRVDRAVLARARPDKERKCAELLQGDRCHLVVVAIETGGRWSTESLDFVKTLASARARDAPHILRRSAYLDAEMVPHAGRVLWEGFRPLVSPPAVDLQGTDGPPPDLADLFLD